MATQIREFQAGPDPFGRTWNVEFLWLQNGISIRHADTVDCKFAVDGGLGREEKVIALPHPLLLELTAKAGVPLSDPLCIKLASERLRSMIETGEDLEKPLVTVTRPDLERAFDSVTAAAAR
jgi:hypothetical protein